MLKIKSGYMMVRDSIICGGVHMWRCSYVEVFICGGVHMWKCSYVEVFICGGVHMWRCSYVEVFICGSVHMWRCSYVEVFICGIIIQFGVQQQHSIMIQSNKMALVSTCFCFVYTFIIMSLL